MSVYKSNCAVTVGLTLQRPLISWEEALYRDRAISTEGRCSAALGLMKVFLRVLLSILILPLLILPWAVGKLICRITKPRIDDSGLSLAPDLLDLIIEEEDDPSLDLLDLVKEWEGLPHPRDMANSDYDLLTDDFRAMVANLQDCDDKATRKRFCDEVMLYLRVILKKIRSGELKGDQKKDVLRELAEVSSHCPPTWLEGCVKLYSEIVGKRGVVSNQILGYVQDYKEGLILSLCESVGQWHDLNRIRAYFGRELGLVVDRVGYDHYAMVEIPSSYDILLRWLFLQKYQDVSKLVNAVCTMINRRGYSVSIYEELLRIVKDSNQHEDPTGYVAQQYYREDTYELKPEGVVVLLKELGVIK